MNGHIRKAVVTMGLALIGQACFAEPMRYDKDVVASVTAVFPQARDGSWLKWACGEYRTLFREPGTLEKNIDTKRENLGAGLCSGFIAGIMAAPGISPCVAKQKLEPEVVLGYLQAHPELSLKPAGQVVADALSAGGKCD